MPDLSNVLELNIGSRSADGASHGVGAQAEQNAQEVTGLNIANDKANGLSGESASTEQDVLSQSNEQGREQFFEDIRENLERINEYIPLKATNLIFEFDELGDPPVVKVIDKESEETIREIPPKEFRDVAKALEEFADKISGKTGVLFNKTI